MSFRLPRRSFINDAMDRICFKSLESGVNISDAIACPLAVKPPNDQIPPWCGYTIRLDGVGFSKFTRRLGLFQINKQYSPREAATDTRNGEEGEMSSWCPFSQMFRDVMIETTKDLVKKLNASMGYVSSDEILVVVPPVSFTPITFLNYRSQFEENQTVHSTAETSSFESDDIEELLKRSAISHPNDDLVLSTFQMAFDNFRRSQPISSYPNYSIRDHIFSGRISKLLTTSSSFATARFLTHFLSKSPTLLSLLTSSSSNDPVVPHFDARIMPLPNALPLVFLLTSRQKDHRRNALAGLLRPFSNVINEVKKRGVGGDVDVVRGVRDETGIDVVKCGMEEGWFGVCVKRKKVVNERKVHGDGTSEVYREKWNSKDAVRYPLEAKPWIFDVEDRNATRILFDRVWPESYTGYTLT